MAPAAFLVFFGIVLVVFVGSGVLGMLQSRRKRNLQLKSGTSLNRKQQRNPESPRRRTELPPR
jgi:hypothetical protein